MRLRALAKGVVHADVAGNVRRIAGECFTGHL
jgi:hypothetical protein